MADTSNLPLTMEQFRDEFHIKLKWRTRATFPYDGATMEQRATMEQFRDEFHIKRSNSKVFFNFAFVFISAQHKNKSLVESKSSSIIIPSLIDMVHMSI